MRIVVFAPTLATCSFSPAETNASSPRAELTTPTGDTGASVDTDEPADTGTPVDTGPLDTHPPFDTGDTGEPADTDDVVLWRDVAYGWDYFGYDDVGAIDCATVVPELLTNQPELDTFWSDVDGLDLVGKVDFLTEVAVGGHLICSHGGLEVEVVDVRPNGDVLVVDYQIIEPPAFPDISVERFHVIAVSGTQWTAATATSTVVDACAP